MGLFSGGRWRLPRLPAWAVASVLVPFLVLVSACWYDRGVVLDEERTQIAATIDALAQHVQSMLRNSSLALDLELNETRGKDWLAIRQSPELQTLLRRLSDSLPELADAFLVDPNGVVAASSGSDEQVGTDVEDRDFFRQARAAPGAIVITPLAQESGQASDRVFVVSRARTLDGRFDGVAVVTVWSAYFQNLLAPILDTQRSAIATLLRGDGTELFRHPYVLVRRGQLGPDNAALRRAAIGPGVRSFTALSSGDGREKIGAAEVIPGWDLTIAYGLDKRQVLAQWYSDLPFFVAIAAASSLVLLFAAWRAVRAEEDRRRAERALLQAAKMEALGRLTGGVAHDFNNLLAAILGSLQLLRRNMSGPEDQRQLAIAERAAERGAKLVSQMLTFARNSPVKPVAVDFNALIRDADGLVRRTSGANVRVRQDLEPRLWWALADPVQLELSLLNLVANARDAMPKGGEVTLATRNLPAKQARSAKLAERDHVVLEVSDTGRGMSEQEQSSAFEPFFTTKEPGKGTGLGLSMVYGFARQLGGTVTIESRPGATRISLCLPRTDPPLGEPTRSADPIPAGSDADAAPAAEPVDCRDVPHGRLG